MKIEIKFICVAICILVGSGTQTAQAVDVTKPLPQISGDNVLSGAASHFRSDYDRGVKGDCVQLLQRLEEAAVSKEYGEAYASNIVYGEMYDRAVCVPYDPAKAFVYFKDAADFGNPIYFSIVGWKYFHGHGVEQSEVLANEQFKLLLTRFGVHVNGNSQNEKDKYRSFLGDRNIPALLLNGVDWKAMRTATAKETLNLAQELLDGSGVYFDKSPLLVDTRAAFDILSGLDNPEGRYVFAMESLKGTFGEKQRKEGQWRLDTAALCGYLPAMLDLAQFWYTGEYGFEKNLRRSYEWYLRAQLHGAEVSKLLAEIEPQVGEYSRYYVQQHYKSTKIPARWCQPTN